MSEFWMELRPVDAYRVKMNGIVTQFDQKVATMLYQPLMGADCLAVYQTLLTEIEENRLWSAEHAHTQLLNLLSLSLKDFFQARIKLEGLGLLKTYLQTENEERRYIYEVLPPLSPAQFFNDGLLNIYLYSKIGTRQYHRLRQFFADDSFSDTSFSEITRSFQDVFEAFRISDVEHVAPQDEELFERKKATKIELDAKNFDFQLFYQTLSPNLIRRSAINHEVEQTILNMNSIYGVKENDMVNYLYRALNSDGSINTEMLRKIIRDSYQIEHRTLPTLEMKREKDIENAKPKEEINDETALQLYLERVTPFQLLVDISDGATPAETDLRVVEEVMANQNLPEPVMNVLIEYVLLRLDRKLSKNYMMTIAAHWKRKNIQTAKEAMDLALSEHEKYKRLREEPEPKAKRNNAFSKNNRKEVLPDWFDKEETKPASSELSHKEKDALNEQVRQIKEQLKR
ncbi:replication initiation and membrane attachment family protein [Listeria fleischmannii]|uniref:Helicase DnaB n=1 Tax=Listeria fleischmannii TaxID=1069827 RepID=A0A841YBG7_9LIST|nr:replication initiation and membrane attachment family protein [Listeria fleischmannii]EIA21368.1 chromosome replication initiation / membrane attachment protein DnaB [Listeria fleischmannii subsp. coloradonensis]MBC1397539.1 helicase DnaB [Listeria fleischmannii]MBC1425908.1 helicase DnaB [Listeria fleischmannii]STY35072.1 Replication initiation and membrane attachment protein [Listeria fleischmannii subsp. coloradonensis]